MRCGRLSMSAAAQREEFWRQYKAGKSVLGTELLKSCGDDGGARRRRLADADSATGGSVCSRERASNDMAVSRPSVVVWERLHLYLTVRWHR